MLQRNKKSHFVESELQFIWHKLCGDRLRSQSCQGKTKQLQLTTCKSLLRDRAYVRFFLKGNRKQIQKSETRMTASVLKKDRNI